MCLDEQFILTEATTEEQSVNRMSCFVQAFYNMASSMLVGTNNRKVAVYYIAL